MYAQVLYLHHDYRAAAPMFEKGLAMIPPSGAPFKSATIARRMMRDQAGMSYGISGDLAKSRSIFEKGVADDPSYPLNYYNLACADAGEKKLSAAKMRLKQAFDRKAGMNPGESMPIPTEDDSFLPYKDDREFWTFLQGLTAGK
jgi:tetratricopeptide (TPR) repeat protein